MTETKVPLFTVAKLARPDLWEQWTQLNARDASCACSARARLEVQLSWADHERQESWQHARPYIEQAERLAESARQEADLACPLTALVADPSPAHEPAVPALAPDLVIIEKPVEQPEIAAPPQSPAPLPELEPLPEPKVISLATLPWSVHFDEPRERQCRDRKNPRQGE